MLSIFKKERSDMLVLLGFLIGSSRFLKFFWWLIAFFSAIGIIGLVINSKALMLTGYVVSLMLIFFNLLQLPVYFRLALTRKTWFLCGNAYSQLLWLVVFMGLLFSLLFAPLFFYNTSSLMQVISLCAVVFSLYSLFFAATVVFNLLFSSAPIVLVGFLLPHFGIDDIKGGYYFLLACAAFCCMVWAWVIHSLRRVKNPGVEVVTALGFPNVGIPGGSGFFEKLISCFLKKYFLTDGPDKIYFLAAERPKSIVVGLLSALCKVFFLLLIIAIVSVVNGYSISLFFESEFVLGGLVLPCAVLLGIGIQRKIVSNARRLWLTVGGCRRKIFLLVEKYCVYNICIELLVVTLLLMSVIVFSKNYNENIGLFFIATIFLLFLVFYLQMIIFCLNGMARTLIVIGSVLVVFVMLHAIFNHAAVTLILVAMLGAFAWIARHYAVKLWLHIDFQESKI